MALPFWCSLSLLTLPSEAPALPRLRKNVPSIRNFSFSGAPYSKPTPPLKCSSKPECAQCIVVPDSRIVCHPSVEKGGERLKIQPLFPSLNAGIGVFYCWLGFQDSICRWVSWIELGVFSCVASLFTRVFHFCIKVYRNASQLAHVSLIFNVKDLCTFWTCPQTQEDEIIWLLFKSLGFISRTQREKKSKTKQET